MRSVPEIAFMLTVLCKRAEPSSPFNTGLSAAGSLPGSHQTFVRNPRALVSTAGLRGPRPLPGGQRRRSLYLEEQLARLPHQFSNARALRNGLASITAMFKRVLIASWGA